MPGRSAACCCKARACRARAGRGSVPRHPLPHLNLQGLSRTCVQADESTAAGPRASPRDRTVRPGLAHDDGAAGDQRKQNAQGRLGARLIPLRGEPVRHSPLAPRRKSGPGTGRVQSWGRGGGLNASGGSLLLTHVPCRLEARRSCPSITITLASRVERFRIVQITQLASQARRLGRKPDSKYRQTRPHSRVPTQQHNAGPNGDGRQINHSTHSTSTSGTNLKTTIHQTRSQVTSTGRGHRFNIRTDTASLQRFRSTRKLCLRRLPLLER